MFARARRDEAAARATGDLRLALRALRESRALPSSRRSSRAPSVPVQPDVEGDPTWRAIEITRWGGRGRETAHVRTLEASLVARPRWGVWLSTSAGGNLREGGGYADGRRLVPTAATTPSRRCECRDADDAPKASARARVPR